MNASEAASDLATRLAQSARDIDRPPGIEEMLQTLVSAARDSMNGFDQVGISTSDRHSTTVTRAFSGDLVPALDQLQYQLREGPCFDTFHEHNAMVVAPWIGKDPRWPAYAPAAADRGLRSQLAVRLFLDARGTVGGLNFYSTTTDEIDPHDVAMAELFATHAAIALGHQQEVAGLNEALTSRKVIGQAIGIIMERHQIDEDRAFATLTRLSSQTNTKLRVLAQRLVDLGNEVQA